MRLSFAFVIRQSASDSSSRRQQIKADQSQLCFLCPKRVVVATTNDGTQFGRKRIASPRMRSHTTTTTTTKHPPPHTIEHIRIQPVNRRELLCAIDAHKRHARGRKQRTNCRRFGTLLVPKAAVMAMLLGLALVGWICYEEFRGMFSTTTALPSRLCVWPSAFVRALQLLLLLLVCRKTCSRPSASAPPK